MRFRKLRIAWSVFWSLAAVLLIVLWVRSYWWLDNMVFSVPETTIAISEEGALGITSYAEKHDTGYSSILSIPVKDIPTRLRSGPIQKWSFSSNPFSTGIRFPHWFAVLIFAGLAVAPWSRQLHWHFSLRTLLIATTLIAIVLGAIVAVV